MEQEQNNRTRAASKAEKIVIFFKTHQLLASIIKGLDKISSAIFFAQCTVFIITAKHLLR